jgi:hypothetical protein
MRQVKAKKHRWVKRFWRSHPEIHTNKTNRNDSLDGVSVAEARSVSRLCDRSAADVVRP